MKCQAAGALLLAHRERSGLKPAVVARHLGLHESQIHRAESGDDITMGRFIGLCDLYKLKRGEVMDLLTEYKRGFCA